VNVEISPGINGHESKENSPHHSRLRDGMDRIILGKGKYDGFQARGISSIGANRQ
jgi:hypothetical protein